MLSSNEPYQCAASQRGFVDVVPADVGALLASCGIPREARVFVQTLTLRASEKVRSAVSELELVHAVALISAPGKQCVLFPLIALAAHKLAVPLLNTSSALPDLYWLLRSGLAEIIDREQCAMVYCWPAAAAVPALSARVEAMLGISHSAAGVWPYGGESVRPWLVHALADEEHAVVSVAQRIQVARSGFRL